MSAQWSDSRLREVLASIPTADEEYGAWWATAGGRGLVEQVVEHVAARVTSAIRRQLSVEVDRDEVVSLLFLALMPGRMLLRALTSESTERPWAYLHRCLVNSLLDEVGSFYRRELHDETLLVVDSATVGEITTLEAAIASTSATLEPATPTRLVPHLEHAVGWMADRAVDGRLSHLHTDAAKETSLLRRGFSAPQLRALANATVGARPDHSRTSLLAAYLLEPQWQPAFSRPHRQALALYARRMFAAEQTGVKAA